MEMPKKLKKFRDTKADNYNVEYGGGGDGYRDGFNACFEAMSKTHIPREQVEKLVEALLAISSLDTSENDYTMHMSVTAAEAIAAYEKATKETK